MIFRRIGMSMSPFFEEPDTGWFEDAEYYPWDLDRDGSDSEDTDDGG